MKFYAQWLDGEYYKMKNNDSVLHSPTIHHNLSGWLKVHALFDDSIVLNDVQLIDSGVFLDLISDDDFKEFIKVPGEFLELRSSSLAGQSDTKVGRVLAGLARATVEGWVSSAFENDDCIKRYANAVLDFSQGGDLRELHGSQLPESLSEALKSPQSTSDKRRLRAVHDAVRIFLELPDKCIQPSSGKETNYLEVLQEVADGTYRSGNSDLASVSEPQQADIEGLIEDIKKLVPKETDRLRRSKYRAALAERMSEVVSRMRWNTVVQAWNCALSRSLGTPCTSIAPLENAIELGLYVESPTEVQPRVAVDKDGKKCEVPLWQDNLAEIKPVPWDPYFMGWNDVNEAIKQTVLVRKEFRDFRDSVDRYKRKIYVDQMVDRLSKVCRPCKCSGLLTALSWSDVALLAFGVEEAITPIGLGVKGLDISIRFCDYGKRWVAARTIKKRLGQTGVDLGS